MQSENTARLTFEKCWSAGLMPDTGPFVHKFPANIKEALIFLRQTYVVSLIMLRNSGLIPFNSQPKK